MTHPLEDENRRLREALTVLLESLEGFNVSGVYFDRPWSTKGLALRPAAALATEPASVEAHAG